MIATVTVVVMLRGDLAEIGQKVSRLRQVADAISEGGKPIRFDERTGAPRTRATAASTARSQDQTDGSPEQDELALEAAAGVNDEAAGVV